MNPEDLTPDELHQLETLAENAPEPGIRQRARLLLLYQQGLLTHQIARQVGLSRGRVRHWRGAFRRQGWSIFREFQPVEPAVIEEQLAPEAAPAFLRFKAPGVLADDPMAEAGRKVLRFHFYQMLAHEQGTRLGEDIEELHDMRVATRRMRAAFEIFGDYFSRKAVKAHLRALRSTGRSLGRVRDLDVFMEKAVHYLDASHEDDRPGLEPLLHGWEAERESARAEMLAHLDSQAYRQFVENFGSFLETPGEGVRKLDSMAPQVTRHIAPTQIYARLGAVRAYAALLDSASLEQLHGLRIQFKRLRYTLEYFREILGPEAKDVINEIKTIQDHLGDLNDANVACQILNDFLSGWEARQLHLSLGSRQSTEPIVHYLAARHAERHRLLVEFPTAWERFNRADVRLLLAQAVSIL